MKESDHRCSEEEGECGETNVRTAHVWKNCKIKLDRKC